MKKLLFLILFPSLLMADVTNYVTKGVIYSDGTNTWSMLNGTFTGNAFVGSGTGLTSVVKTSDIVQSLAGVETDKVPSVNAIVTNSLNVQLTLTGSHTNVPTSQAVIDYTTNYYKGVHAFVSYGATTYTKLITNGYALVGPSNGFNIAFSSDTNTFLANTNGLTTCRFNGKARGGLAVSTTINGAGTIMYRFMTNNVNTGYGATRGFASGTDLYGGIPGGLPVIDVTNGTILSLQAKTLTGTETITNDMITIFYERVQ
jgi:hypothetical protein